MTLPPSTRDSSTPAPAVLPALPAADRRFLLTRAFLPVWAGLCLLAVLSALVASPPVELGFALVLGSTLVLGLPHGAVDHLLVRRLVRGERRRDDDRRPGRWGQSFSAAHPFLAVGVVYLLLGGAYLVCWFVAPLAAFGAFLLLTWVHWGLGDLYAVLAVGGGAHLRGRGQRALAVAVRGGIPILVPFVAHPATYRTVAELVVGTFDLAAADLLAVAFAPAVRATVGAGLVLATGCSLALGYHRATRRGAWAVDAGETVLLAAFFAAVHPVVAIGLYFPLWHSLRHVLRVELLDPPAVAGFREGRVAPALARFARDAAPLTAGALLLFVGLFLVVPAASTSLASAAAVYLVLLAVLTLPHTVVTAWADGRQGVWDV